MFVITLLIIYYCFIISLSSPVQCDNVTMSLSSSSSSNNISINPSIAEIGVLQQFDGISQDMSELKQMSRQSFISGYATMIKTFFKGMAFLTKNLVVTYQWLHPELTLSRCVASYARSQYPELMQTPMTYDNMAKFVRTVYKMISSSITEYMNENRQEVKLERERIGAKLAQITADDTMSLNRDNPSMAISSMVLPSAESSYRQPSTSLLPPSPSPVYSNVNMVQNINDILNRYRRSQGKSEYMKRSNDFQLTKGKDFDVSSNDKQNKLPSRMNEFDTTAAGRSDTNGNNNNNSPSNEIILSFKTQAKDNLIPMPKIATTTTTTKAKTATDNIKDIKINVTQIATNTDPFETKLSKSIESKDNFNLTWPIAKTKDSRFSVMYVGPRQFPNGIKDINSNRNTVYDDDDGSINTDAEQQQQQNDEVTATHQNKGETTKNNDKSESIFDFENAILETFGFHRGKGVKSVSLTGCTQKYVINILWRMVEDFVTGV